MPTNDIQYEFTPMILRYKDWYSLHIQEIKIFEPYNPFKVMYDLMLSTEREILKYSYRKTNVEVSSEKPMPFSHLFKREHRAKMPDEVIRLLGPGEADAWEMDDDKKKWTYLKPEGAIMIPYYLLEEKGYIEKNPREKKLRITTWLKEFGIEYKPKTFDRSPKDSRAVEHFTDYINKLK